MDDAPVDEWYRWLGVAIASLAVLGVAAGLPTRAGPDASELATTIDAVAASDHPATGEHPVTAEAIRLGPATVSVRNGDGADTASLGHRTTPVRPGSRLGEVLRGRAPEAAFDSPAALGRAAATARARRPDWRPAGDRVLVRHVSWEAVDVTLVGA